MRTPLQCLRRWRVVACVLGLLTVWRPAVAATVVDDPDLIAAVANGCLPGS